MYNVGVCAHFNIGNEAIGGQTIKTRIITDTIREILGPEKVIILDTHTWKKNPIKFLIQCVLLTIRAKNIIILPAYNGVRVLIPLFFILTKLLRRKIHYITVGAWLPSFLINKVWLLQIIKKIDYIYVETNTLKSRLNDLGISRNVNLMPNFKNIVTIISGIEQVEFVLPYRLCIVSRINYQKGIESAINVINKINSTNLIKTVELDIYGPIEEGYLENFCNILKKQDNTIKYKGILDYNKTVDTIKGYYLLIFPTKYYNEGFPGAILDSFMSGVPVLASQWESWGDIIEEGVNGLSYEFDNENDFYEKLKFLTDNKELVKIMRQNCIHSALNYDSKKAIRVLLQNIETNEVAY